MKKRLLVLAMVVSMTAAPGLVTRLQAAEAPGGQEMHPVRANGDGTWNCKPDCNYGDPPMPCC